MITLKSSGNFNMSFRLLNKLKNLQGGDLLDQYGQKGVDALKNATPKDSGLTSESWDYTIEYNNRGAKIIWTNSNRNQGVNIAIILQYGHATRGGGYVQGIDYINPALRPIFEEMADKIWKEATR